MKSVFLQWMFLIYNVINTIGNNIKCYTYQLNSNFFNEQSVWSDIFFCIKFGVFNSIIRWVTSWASYSLRVDSTLKDNFILFSSYCYRFSIGIWSCWANIICEIRINIWSWRYLFTCYPTLTTTICISRSRF